MRAAVPIVSFALLALLAGLAGLLAVAGPRPACVLCRVELRSWVVSRPHPGRHLYLMIECPPGYEHLNGRVEYTSAALRWDFRPVGDPAFGPRVARMSRGAILEPFFGDVNATRLEGLYIVTLEQAKCLQRDRMFSRQYDLLGPNSTSGLLAVLKDCGCPVPEHIARSTGWLSEFPGAEMPPGSELDATLWSTYGVATGPTPTPTAGQGEATAPPMTRSVRMQRIMGGE